MGERAIIIQETRSLECFGRRVKEASKALMLRRLICRLSVTGTSVRSELNARQILFIRDGLEPSYALD